MVDVLKKLSPFSIPKAEVENFSWGWVENKSSLKGKLFIITGANAGLGFETAKALAMRRATVVLACRNMERAAEAIKKIRAVTKKGGLIPLELDLTSFKSIRQFCSIVDQNYPKFYCLIHNAGVSTKVSEKTRENIEIHCAINYIGPFLLANLLFDNIIKHNSKVVIVSSQLHQLGTIDFSTFGEFSRKPKNSQWYNNHYYNNSKLMSFYFAKELYKKGIDVHVCCPGLCYTNMFRNFNPTYLQIIKFAPSVLSNVRTAEHGAQSIIYCATDNVNTKEKNPVQSYIVVDLKQVKSKIELSDETSEKLWNESGKLCGLRAFNRNSLLNSVQRSSINNHSNKSTYRNDSKHS